ncbi:hypothetical protein DRW03_31565 [Corallococcus sp. H22C18031201]|uniref:hypothetical protein n=1 Tax=Citreicoccus inhibens TaxID=2849499 RepID=UPI000E74298D|nr:hypothetical protein [Citreicoccus inhibens]MBU8894355.1 hypothetical protein [Citreicoccus inhibens]RJS16205.1 hypothetical protein DRW03_31565 [Corallococcus sp. H22C18031201]
MSWRLGLLLCGGVLLALPASAASDRGVDLTLAPVGGFVLRGPAKTRLSGLSAGLGWAYRRSGSLLEVGGHVSSCQWLTEATPLSLRWAPLGDAPVRPYLGLGATLLVAHARSEPDAPRVLQVGAELSAGVGLELGGQLFLSAEARYQNVSARGEPFSGERQVLGSLYLGLGLHL